MKCTYLTQKNPDDPTSHCELLDRCVEDGCEWCFEKQRISKQEDDRDNAQMEYSGD